MKIFLVIMMLSIAFIADGQDLKKQKVKSDYPPSKETFYVLKSNSTVKHGKYEKQYGGLITKGQHENGAKAGVWEYYDKNGELIQKYNFTEKHFVQKRSFDLSKKHWYKNDDILKEINLDSENKPIFLGGEDGIYYYVWNMRYPVDARINGIQGKVYVSAIITEKGEIIDEKVEEGLGYGMDEEALRVIKMIPDEWVPGTVNGEPVDIKILIPLTFKLG